MGLIFYKGNKNITGSACHWTFNSKVGEDKAVYLEIVKQVGWNEETNKGTFKDGETIRLKFNVEKEIGGFLRVLEDLHKVVLNDQKKNENPAQKASYFHTSTNGTTQIEFVKTMYNNAVLYGLSVSNNKDGNKAQFRISFDADEGVSLRNWLTFAQEHIFSGIYAEDKKNYENKAAKATPKKQTAEKEEDIL